MEQRGPLDLFEKIKSNRGPLGKYSREGHGYFFFPKLEGAISAHMHFRGKERLVWSLNNYLGLANHPEVRQADAEAAKEWGMALPMGSRMLTGNSRYHEQLEDELAAFVHKEDAFLFNYGYQGMVSAIDALVSRNDVIIYDSEAHACIVDGVRMHVGKRFVFRHNDAENLRKQLERATLLITQGKEGTPPAGGILVITEGVFGMAGDQSPLREIVALKEKFRFRLLVDDAHGFGVMGKTGAGTGEEQGVQDDIDLYFGTFAKAMASIGGFIAGKEDILEYIRYNSRSQIYAKSLPMPLVIGALKRMEIMKKEPELRHNLWKIARHLQDGLRSAGFDLGKTRSVITPVYLSGDLKEIEAAQLVIDLRENFAIFCSMVIYPVVPRGTILLRLIPTAVHTPADVDYTIEAFKKIRSRLEAGQYKGKEIFPSLPELSQN